MTALTIVIGTLHQYQLEDDTAFVDYEAPYHLEFQGLK